MNQDSVASDPQIRISLWEPEEIERDGMPAFEAVFVSPGEAETSLNELVRRIFDGAENLGHVELDGFSFHLTVAIER